MKALRVALLALTVFFAQQTLAAEKIAVLSVQEALLSTKAAASFREELKKEFSDDQRKVVDLEKQARQLREKIQKNAGLASESELKKQKMQFQKVFTEFQKNAQALQQKKAQREQGFIAEMKPKLDTVIRQLIESEDIDIILSKRAAVYSSKDVDITARVTELLDKQK